MVGDRVGKRRVAHGVVGKLDLYVRDGSLVVAGLVGGLDDLGPLGEELGGARVLVAGDEGGAVQRGVLTHQKRGAIHV